MTFMIHPAISILYVLTLVAIAGWMLLLTRLITGFREAPRIPPLKSRADESKVTAIVPARNEEDQLKVCLGSLLAEPMISTIMVVDDHSDDNTVRVAEEFVRRANTERVKVLKLPHGVTGKGNACHYAALQSSTDLILFVDADTRTEAGTVTRASLLMENRNFDALSLVGRFRCPTLWDRIATPLSFALLNSFIKLSDVSNRSKKAAYFYGSFILIKRHEYLRIGGHSAISKEIVEDRALGHLAKRAGLRIAIAYAPDALSTEWAPGLRDNVQALKRVLTSTMRNGLAEAVLLTATAIILCLVPIAAVIVGLLLVGYGSMLGLLLVGATSILTQLTLVSYAAKLIKVNPIYSVGALVAQFILIVAVCRSLYAVLRGSQVEWRGRLHPIPPLRAH